MVCSGPGKTVPLSLLWLSITLKIVNGVKIVFIPFTIFNVRQQRSFYGSAPKAKAVSRLGDMARG